MSLSSISSQTTALYQWQNQQLGNAASGDAKKPASGPLAALFKGSSMSSQVSSMVELTKYAMDGMGLDSASRVTFSQITRYRDRLSSEFNTAVKDGLAGLGVDPETRFTIKAHEDGTVAVESSNDTNKVAIQRFFDDNPALVKKFRQIEALAGLNDARKAMQISPTEMRKRLQIESMASWWAGSGQASAYFGNYSGNNLSLLSSLNLNV